MGRFAVLIALVLLGPASALPLSSPRAVRRVPQDYAGIQAAIDASSAGDTVLVSRGTYPGGLTIGKPLTLASAWISSQDPADVAATILHGGSPILQVGANDVKILGLTFQGGSKAAVLAGRDIELQRNRFLNNGGDQVSFEHASGAVRDCHFEGAGDDGIDIDGSAGNISIENNTILRPRDDGLEERLYATKGSSDLHRITIRNNFISGAKEDGIQLIDYPGASRREIRIERNTIVQSAMAGIGSMPDGNTKENYGGAAMEEKVYVLHNTLVGNHHGITGGDRMIILNNIVKDSPGVALKRAAGRSRIANNCLWNNGKDDADSVAADETLRADPLLDASFRLRPGSPCIDRGAASLDWNGEAVTAPGPHRGTPDLGAHETGAGELPTVTVQADGAAGEPTRPGTFTLTRSGGLAEALTVKYSVGGTATPGSDYRTLSGAVTIPAGSASAAVVLAPVDDRDAEPSESVVLTLSPDPSYAVGTPASATVAIADDDTTLPTVTIAATDAEAREAGLDPAVFTVTRSGATTAPLVVKFSIGGDATNGVDYQAIGNSVTIPAGSAHAAVRIVPIDDALAEDEEVDLTLVPSPEYAVGTPGGASITITDND